MDRTKEKIFLGWFRISKDFFQIFQKRTILIPIPLFGL